MGSLAKACISGFLCRLCSEMHRTVIHIYGDQGKRLSLVEKINGYLPITISPTDPLPKTICTTCLRRVQQHYALLMRLSRIREQRELDKLVKLRKQPNTPSTICSNPDDTDDESSNRGGITQSHKISQAPTASDSNDAEENAVSLETPHSSTNSVAIVVELSTTRTIDPPISIESSDTSSDTTN